MISRLNDAAVQVGALLLAAPDSATRASLIAAAIVEQIPDCACSVHRFVADVEEAWTAIGIAGPITIERSSFPAGSSLTEALFADPPQAVIHAGADIRREEISHLHVARTIVSLAYVPLQHEGQLIGAIEIATFSEPLLPTDLKQIEPTIELASPAILAAEDFEQQRQTLLDSVHRISQLYDLEKSLNATLEFDTVTAMIPEKVAAMLPCQAIHLWLFDGDHLRLFASHGEDGTVDAGVTTQAPGEGYVAEMAEEGEPLLIDDPGDERLAQRNEALGDESGIPPVRNSLMVPLMQDEGEIGVLEAINKDGDPFDEDDQFFLVSIAETVSSALKNASLMQAERKLEILKTLVRVSSEITSTLRLDRLLQIMVNSPQNVLPYQRCAIALDHRGRLQLKAISGMPTMPMGDAQVERLRQLMVWLSDQEDALHLRMLEEEEVDSDPELPSQVKRYFEQSGCRALYSVPLTDDQGRVGLLLYESGDPDFLDLPHTEMIKVLAGQATVAIRNALLYREVPLISVIEPLMMKKKALLGNRRSRWMTAGIVFESVIFLSFCPFPLRVAGDAVVAPQHLVTIAAPVDGNVDAVYAHEGQHVSAGETLGAMNDWQWRTDLAASEAKYQEAMLVMQNDLAHESAQAGADRTQAEYLRAEAARARTRLDDAQLRSPIDGVVVTANLQNVAGKHLDAGDTFAQVLDLSNAVVQVAVPERDVTLLRSGMNTSIKLDSYPQRTWHNPVSIISPVAQPANGERTFIVEIPVPNSEAALRAGMTGRAKILVGWKPVGYVLLRKPALWVWQTLWNWIGW
ncbi:MAG TPA: efflux RND transporter periplasmic adaptor subunit [Terracidiphilus sp.]|nr:efflux RND transporter periplasmic adaptor subunit [Terracidiphilus sp.]